MKNTPWRPAITYILATKKNGTIYVGVTTRIHERLSQHRNDPQNSFSKRYGTVRLVHFEVFERVQDAIAREKQLKNWRREWKINLIEEANPDWHDVSNLLPFS